MGKDKPKNVLALIAEAMKRKEAKAAKKAKKATLAQRFVPKKGHRG